MDNLTHTLVGAGLARAGLGRRAALACATLIVAANAPDVDVLSYAEGSTFALSFRRGITHGVPAMLVLPFVVAGAMVAWDRLVRARAAPGSERASFAALLPVAFVGLLTHPALDWLNTYGMRWWLPFDPRWSYGDSLFIVDPWLWLLLGAAAALGGLRGARQGALWLAVGAFTSWLVLTTPLAPPAAKVAWGVGVALVAAVWLSGRPLDGNRRVLAARGLLGAAALYVAASVGLHRAAADDVRASLLEGPGDGSEVVMIAPRPARPFQSDVLVAGAGGYVRGAHDWTAARPLALALHEGTAAVTTGPGVSHDEAMSAIAAARVAPDVARYLVWSRFPFWRVERSAAGYAVTVGDMRFRGRGGRLGGVQVEIRGS